MFHLYNTGQDYNNKDISPRISSDEYIGVSTGNWGCGAFGGNPEIKSMIQWIAASQALRPFVNYYTFEDASLERLGEVLSIPSLTFRPVLRKLDLSLYHF